jgi:hypothetical protein
MRIVQVALELWPTNRGGAPDRTIRRALGLGRAAFDDLLGDVQKLSVAELRSVFSPIICFVIPTAQLRAGVLVVRRDYGPQTDAFLGPPQVIQSARGCWNPFQVGLPRAPMPMPLAPFPLAELLGSSPRELRLRARRRASPCPGPSRCSPRYCSRPSR